MGKRILSPVEILLKGKSGGSGGGGGSVAYAAIGSVLYHAGTTPPAGYLACDGTVYNISDYSELAQFFADNYGSANYWGGDGTTTFAVPDWRGEFFRASGQNSRANQGSGAAVGAHQDATISQAIWTSSDMSTPRAGFQWRISDQENYASTYYTAKNKDSRSVPDVFVELDVKSQNVPTGSGQDIGSYASRPTNTSLLVCIKAKMVENMEEIVAAVVRQMVANLDPVGKVIYYAGLSAPANYLACDGTVYNIADYPELAQFFAVNYGSANYWGGDGTTTFAVPDWRGEFFRASGQNSRANQGSGAAVGAHQDATISQAIWTSSDMSTPRAGFQWRISDQENYASTYYTAKNKDSRSVPDVFVELDVKSQNVPTGSGQDIGSYASRPTNTSLLVCIKAA